MGSRKANDFWSIAMKNRALSCFANSFAPIQLEKTVEKIVEKVINGQKHFETVEETIQILDPFVEGYGYSESHLKTLKKRKPFQKKLLVQFEAICNEHISAYSRAAYRTPIEKLYAVVNKIPPKVAKKHIDYIEKITHTSSRKPKPHWMVDGMGICQEDESILIEFDPLDQMMIQRLVEVGLVPDTEKEIKSKHVQADMITKIPKKSNPNSKSQTSHNSNINTPAKKSRSRSKTTTSSRRKRSHKKPWLHVGSTATGDNTQQQTPENQFQLPNETIMSDFHRMLQHVGPSLIVPGAAQSIVPPYQHPYANPFFMQQQHYQMQMQQQIQQQMYQPSNSNANSNQQSNVPSQPNYHNLNQIQNSSYSNNCMNVNQFQNMNQTSNVDQNVHAGNVFQSNLNSISNLNFKNDLDIQNDPENETSSNQCVESRNHEHTSDNFGRLNKKRRLRYDRSSDNNNEFNNNEFSNNEFNNNDINSINTHSQSLQNQIESESAFLSVNQDGTQSVGTVVHADDKSLPSNMFFLAGNNGGCYIIIKICLPNTITNVSITKKGNWIHDKATITLDIDYSTDHQLNASQFVNDINKAIESSNKNVRLKRKQTNTLAGMGGMLRTLNQFPRKNILVKFPIKFEYKGAPINIAVKYDDQNNEQYIQLISEVEGKFNKGIKGNMAGLSRSADHNSNSNMNTNISFNDDNNNSIQRDKHEPNELEQLEKITRQACEITDDLFSLKSSDIINSFQLKGEHAIILVVPDSFKQGDNLEDAFNNLNKQDTKEYNDLLKQTKREWDNEKEKWFKLVNRCQFVISFQENKTNFSALSLCRMEYELAKQASQTNSQCTDAPKYLNCENDIGGRNCINCNKKCIVQRNSFGRLFLCDTCKPGQFDNPCHKSMRDIIRQERLPSIKKGKTILGSWVKDGGEVEYDTATLYRIYMNEDSITVFAIGNWVPPQIFCPRIPLSSPKNEDPLETLKILDVTYFNDKRK